MSAGWKWIAIVTAFLVGNVIAVVVLIASAGSASGRVLPSAYERAADYDELLTDLADSDALGWRVAAAIAGGSVEVRIIDAAGAPVTGARVVVSGYPRVRADAVVTVELREVAGAGGTYRGAFAGGRTGWYDVSVASHLGMNGHVVRLAVEAR